MRYLGELFTHFDVQADAYIHVLRATLADGLEHVVTIPAPFDRHPPIALAVEAYARMQARDNEIIAANICAGFAGGVLQ